MINNFLQYIKYPFQVKIKNIPIRSYSKNIISKNKKKTKYKKKKIPKALKQQVWLNKFGKRFERSCYVSWCNNDINCFTFDCGHNIPESKGGKTDISNLIPICRNCNLGMGNEFTIDQWNDKYKSTNTNKISRVSLWFRSWF